MWNMRNHRALASSLQQVIDWFPGSCACHSVILWFLLEFFGVMWVFLGLFAPRTKPANLSVNLGYVWLCEWKHVKMMDWLHPTPGRRWSSFIGDWLVSFLEHAYAIQLRLGSIYNSVVVVLVFLGILRASTTTVNSGQVCLFVCCCKLKILSLDGLYAGCGWKNNGSYSTAVVRLPVPWMCSPLDAIQSGPEQTFCAVWWHDIRKRKVHKW